MSIPIQFQYSKDTNYLYKDKRDKKTVRRQISQMLDFFKNQAQICTEGYKGGNH